MNIKTIKYQGKQYFVNMDKFIHAESIAENKVKIIYEGNIETIIDIPIEELFSETNLMIQEKSLATQEKDLITSQKDLEKRQTEIQCVAQEIAIQMSNQLKEELIKEKEQQDQKINKISEKVYFNTLSKQEKTDFINNKIQEYRKKYIFE